MAKTISQRISLEGSEDIRKKLEQLGKTGEEAFKQIQDAAKKPITDPGQVDKTRQAIDQLVAAGTKLGQQFQALTSSTRQFGAEGEKAAAQVTAGLNQTNQAAQAVGTGIEQSVTKLGAVIGFIAGVVQAATNKFISLIQQLATALSPGAATKGAVDTATKISDAAEKIKVTTAELVNFRKAADEAGLSNDDLVKSLEKASGVLDKAKGGTADVGNGLNELSVWSNNGTVSVRRLTTATTDLTSAASRAATDLAKLGFSTRAAAMPEGIARFRQLADEIRRMPEGARQAAAGVAVFGSNWQKVVDILHTGQRDIDNTTRSLAEQGKAARQMSAEQVEAANKLGETWKDLGNAIRAIKDLFGSLFVGGAQTRADWLIKLVDGSIALLKTWSQLAEAKKAAFLEGLGETPSEILFKTLLAIGQQLAGLWRDVLVPAGNALVKIFKQISGQFEGVSKSQVAAFFITATAAAIGLSLALQAIGFVLTPLLALFSPFGAILLAAGAAAFLFWDQIAEGAAKVAELVPNSLGLIKSAIANLFAGNFAKAWDQFKQGAVAAFQTVTQSVLQAKGPLGDFARGLVQIGTDAPAAIKFVIDAIIALGRAATFVADTINKIFGTQLTGTDIALIAIVLQLTGGLQALASVATIVGAAIGALIAVLGGPLTIAILAVIALFVKWPKEMTAAFNFVRDAFLNGLQIIQNGLQAVADGMNALISISQTAADAIAKYVLQPLADAMNWLIQATRDAIDWLAKLLGLGSEVGNPGPGGGATGSFAGGGRVGGRGTGTSDSNLAWVSRGEHIMPARAVRQPGVLAFLEALRRSGGNLSRVLDGMGRFAMGGLALPSFAEGGLAGMSNVTIQFPGLQPIGGLRAPADVVEELRKAAAMAQVRSGGRKPSRYS